MFSSDVIHSYVNKSFFMFSSDARLYDSMSYIIGVIIPCFTTFISYLVIGLYLRYYEENYKGERNQASPITQGRLQIHLWILTVDYVFFMIPMIAVDIGFLKLIAKGYNKYQQVSRICYSIYWWMFPVNFIIYVTFIENFRNIYKICLINSLKCIKKQICHNVKWEWSYIIFFYHRRNYSLNKF